MADPKKVAFLADAVMELTKRFNAMVEEDCAKKDAEQQKISKVEAIKKIQAQSKASLVAAFNNPSCDPGIKKLIEKELDDRANRGL